jgi:chromosome segregation ATPase
MELRTSVRDEERRRRDEALANSLQQQIDELRQLLREQATRQQRQEEQARQGGAHTGQVRMDVDELRQEINRALQLRQLEDQRLKQQLSDLQARVDEPLRPLRNVQSQINDVAELLRQQRDQTAQYAKQVEALRAQVESLRGETVRALEAGRAAREALEAVQQAQTAQVREVQKISDQARLIEQEARRRTAAIEQQLENLSVRIDEVGSYRPHLDEAIRQTREDLKIFQPQIDALAQKDKQQEQQTARVQVQSEERDTLMRERVEEIREHLAGQQTALASTIDEAVARLHERISEWEETHRETAGRLTALAVQVSALEQADDRLAEAHWRGEERLLRLQLDQAQAAWDGLMERRQKESNEQ